MSKPQPKIIFFDIDETLYVKNKGYIPESIYKEVLPRLKAKGIIPAIATGRAPSALPIPLKPYLEPIKGFELFVTINGQYNFYKDKVISQYPLTNERIVQLIEKYNELGIIYSFVCPEAIVMSDLTAPVKDAIEPITKDYFIDPNYYQTHDVIQLLAYYPETDDKRVTATGVYGHDLKTVRWHEISVDVLAKENSKARGILDVLKYLNIDIKDAMAFGDGLNDLEMFSTVGFSVAMGNGEPSLKKLADFVTKDIEEDGILYALETLGVI